LLIFLHAENDNELSKHSCERNDILILSFPTSSIMNIQSEAVEKKNISVVFEGTNRILKDKVTSLTGIIILIEEKKIFFNYTISSLFHYTNIFH
jgi:hypothetical protein